MFPWWCVFIAYGLSSIIAVVSAFFVIVRGIEFGDLKVQKWLTSLLTGFFSSILLIQPIKVRQGRGRFVTPPPAVLDRSAGRVLRLLRSQY